MKSVIQLVKTTQGYSIIEDGEEVNKLNGRPSKEKQYNSAPKKFSQQNFTIYPYTFCQQPDYAEKYILVPAKSQWFSLSQVHEIEKRALPEWFKTKKAVFGAVKPDKFQKNQQLYKKYRNYIIDLARNQYISPTKARKGLAGDVCAILRIHAFLEQNGLINYVFPKKKLNNLEGANTNLNETPKMNLAKRKDCIDKDKNIFEKHFDKDHLELLKKLSKKFRPVCHLCEGVCGVLWYEYQQELVLRSFVANLKNHSLKQEDPEQHKQSMDQGRDHSKTKINKQNSFRFILRLCSSCFTSGSIPVILSFDDFQKHSILENFTYSYEEPRDKKKITQQNKLVEAFEKNKLSLKKTAQGLKIPQEELYNTLLSIPVVKIEKLARIDQEEKEQEELNSKVIPNGKHSNENIPDEEIKQNEKLCKETKLDSLVQKFEKQVSEIGFEETKLYEQFIQLWLMKISAKLNKMSDWQKSTEWYADRLIKDQKNTLAEVIKNKV